MQYMGSKNRLSKELIPIIQSYITEDTKGYLEPFVGGANVIDKIKCGKRIGCDVHKELIALLGHIQETTEDLPDTITLEEYNNVKNNQSEYQDWYVGLVGFCGSYSAKWFGGYAKGKDIRDRQNEAIRNIKAQASKLSNIDFRNCDFRQLKNLTNMVIYCDIPYKGTTSYKTSKFPYDEFYAWCKEMSKDNIVLVSEYNMPEEFECIWSKDSKVLINSYRRSNEEENMRIEKLFIYKGDNK